MSVAILGGGAFGTALAVAIGQKRPVTLWARDAAHLLEHRESPRLPGVTLPETVTITADLEQALDKTAILFSMPMQSLEGFAAQISTPLTGKALVACCKGIDLTTLQGPAAILSQHWPQATPAILTGPSFAADIARGLPTALTLACADDALGTTLQEWLSTPTLRLYRTTDVTGAELGGALKNVIAIACGACIGAGLGDSARAALMTRGFAEMTRLAASLGARPETLAGLSGLGDLTLTCTSDLSRNFRYGLALGKGQAFDPTVTVEGAATARAVAQIAQKRGLPLPVCTAVAHLTDGSLTVQDAMTQLLSRPLKEE
ncbi:NAD(P)H-dependent glycerol-3-phosphate dehydrogenase [Tropicibacter oceani]|uniref:Glycerol-3-phosphate dehydrogenase [NAD(P)+] n=1 Tax=Tropicibacter oceani TaxID=3058420 RepID=A0ABY8QIT4_9RHOB|nr:NAD(P)H-dependent glycerol-3-phosphate dehydrogenase [Tropicibacter oceani]WGW04544.1 NAD(P)H-dependent glycerol-3-phosphate dehydrogenase [Tropicibacter oceani]